MQWPLDRCKKIFVEVAKKIFLKATTTAGRWCQKMAQLLRYARLRGPRASLYETKPYKQMSVAVTTIESKTSASRLLTTYMGPVTYDNNGKLASDILVREA
ncbi:hypothetical protein CKAH01_16808 [Colletotrichum kahawae]|uniref:Uncharacterized protein n=1 Tax=Colletotrichum kahawae TaxID=34407 RepID=A0AAD9YEL4_COLKA|nr:hypothetical protein CKAH01_16808 [Colletotrichum kahawae]